MVSFCDIHFWTVYIHSGKIKTIFARRAPENEVRLICPGTLAYIVSGLKL